MKQLGSQNLFLQAGNPTKDISLYLKSNLEGINYFQNSYNDLNSFTSFPGLKFEDKFASSVLDYKWGATSIKILDDIAAVSYGDYTDINKSVLRDNLGGIYAPYFAYTYGSSMNCNEASYSRYTSYPFILPNLDLSTFGGSLGDYSTVMARMSEENSDIDFSNLFILIEYDGYYTNSSGNIATRELIEGKFEIFKYSPIETSTPGTWYYTSYCRYPILNSKYSVDNYTTELSSGLLNSRLLETRVQNYDVEAILNASEDFLNSDTAPTCVRYGFLGYKSITYIKYNPVIKCGRVDLYTKKNGRITQCLDNYFYAPNHNLNDGDIINIDATSSNGISVLNGLKYVMRAGNDKILIFEDNKLTKQLKNIVISSAEYTCVGNLGNEKYQGWHYQKTIYSPTGRNGQCQLTENYDNNAYHSFDSNNTLPLHDKFKDAESYEDIMRRDLVPSINDIDSYTIAIDVDISDPYHSDLPVRNRVSSLDCLWANPNHYVNSYRFGCSIDLKKINNTIYLLVGERGASEIVTYADHYFPYNHPHGRIHLLEISKNNNELLVTSNSAKTFDASSGDSSIKPLIIDTNQLIICDLSKPFVVMGNQDTQSIANNSFIFNKPNTYYSIDTIDGYIYGIFNDDYWYGSMILHRGILTSDYDPENPQAILVGGGGDWIPSNIYSVDSIDPGYNVLYNEDTSKIFYTYCDSFGKSVYLHNSNSAIYLFASSKTKFNILGQEFRFYPYLATENSVYKQIDNGYVHCIKYNGTPSKISKLKKYDPYDSISGSYYVQQYCGERFGNTIKSKENFIYISDPMSPDVSLDGVSTPTLKQSAVNVYQLSSDIINYMMSVKKPDHRSFYYISDTDGYSISEKEDIIKNNSNYKFVNFKVYPSDRFGENFDVNETMLITNGLSDLNDSGLAHTDLSTGDQIIDFFYIAGLDIKLTLRKNMEDVDDAVLVQCVERTGRPGYYYVVLRGIAPDLYDMQLIMVLSQNYIVATDTVDITDNYGVFYPVELNDGTADNTNDGADPTIVDPSTQVSPNTPHALTDYLYVYSPNNGYVFNIKKSYSINKNSSKYAYSTLFTSYPASFHYLGNITYSNNTTNTVTIDDLFDNSFLLLDDRIIIKDKYGYAVFAKENNYNCIYDIVINTPSGGNTENRLNYTNPVIGYGNTESYVHGNSITNGWSLVSSDSYESVSPSAFSYNSTNSFDFGRINDLNLFLNVSYTSSEHINLYQNGSYSISNNVNLYQRGTDGTNNDITLYLGPTTSSGDITLVSFVSQIPSPVTIDQNLNLYLNIPIPTASNPVSLFQKVVENDAGLNLFILPPVVSSGNLNLFMKAHATFTNLSCYDPSLFIDGKGILSEPVDLVMKGFEPGDFNLYISGPVETNQGVNLLLDAITQSYTDNVNLNIYAPEFNGVNLLIPGHDNVSNDVALYLDCQARVATSTTDTGSYTCYFDKGDKIFDISDIAEEQVGDHNSICQQKYIGTGTFGYEMPRLSVSSIYKDYDFYRYGRFKKLIDANDNKMVIVSGNNILIFNKTLDQVDYSSYITPTLTAPSGYSLVESEFLDIKISQSNKLAISKYFQYHKASTNSTIGKFVLYFYDLNSDAKPIKIETSFVFITQEDYLANFSFGALCWKDNYIYYSREHGYQGAIKYRDYSEGYATEYHAKNISETISNFANVEANWLGGIFNFSRLGFGHRIIYHQNKFIVSCPLWSSSLDDSYSTTIKRVHNFNGAVFVFDSNFNLLTTIEDSDRCPHTFFGYDIAGYTSGLFISAINPSKIVRINYTGYSLERTDVSDDPKFGYCITTCESSVFTSLNNKGYSPLDSRYIIYSNEVDEITQYLVPNTYVSSVIETSNSLFSYGGYTYIFRNFDVEYGVGMSTTIRKLSMLKNTRKYGDPTLFIQNNGLSENINLYLETAQALFNNINFNIVGTYASGNSVDFYTMHIPDGQMWSSVPLTIGISPVNNQESFELVVRGTDTSGAAYIEGSVNLIMSGTSNEASDNVPLVLGVSASGEVSNTIPLIIQHNTEWSSVLDNVNMLLTGSGNGMFWQVVTNNRNLFIKGSDIISNSVPLYLKRIGDGGGEEKLENINLHLLSKTVSDGVSLYSNGISGLSETVNLVIPNTKGSSTKNINLFTRGYEE